MPFHWRYACVPFGTDVTNNLNSQAAILIWTNRVLFIYDSCRKKVVGKRVKSRVKRNRRWSKRRGSDINICATKNVSLVPCDFSRIMSQCQFFQIPEIVMSTKKAEDSCRCSFYPKSPEITCSPSPCVYDTHDCNPQTISGTILPHLVELAPSLYNIN